MQQPIDEIDRTTKYASYKTEDNVKHMSLHDFINFIPKESSMRREYNELVKRAGQPELVVLD